MSPTRVVVGCAVASAAVILMVAGVRYARSVEGTLKSAGDAPLVLQFLRDPKPLPPLVVRDLDGRSHDSADWKGKVVLVNFWATWCPPCREEIPDLIALQEKYRDRLIVIGISEDEGAPDAVRAWAREHGINYPVAMSTPAIEALFPGIVGLPTTFLLDRETRVAARHVGLLNAARTEVETRALAGLETRASIEHVDADKPVGLDNAAQAREIPGIDLDALPPAQRAAALQRLNEEGCSCGCGFTVARCRIEDPDCDVSLPLAKKIVADIAATSAGTR